MKQMIACLIFASFTLFAQTQIEPPQKNQEICFIRKYTPDHLAKNPKQRIKAAYASIKTLNSMNISSFGVMNLKGKTFFTSGTIVTKLPSALVKVTLEGRGEYLINQNQKQPDKITLTVSSDLDLEENNWIIDESIPEGTAYEKMSIPAKSADSVLILERQELTQEDSCRKTMERLAK